MYEKKREQDVTIAHMKTPIELPRMKSIRIEGKVYELPKLKLNFLKDPNAKIESRESSYRLSQFSMLK